jgi:hypothetical protein
MNTIDQHLDNLFNLYDPIIKSPNMEWDIKIGYLMAVVRIDPRITGLNHFDNKRLFSIIRTRIVKII